MGKLQFIGQQQVRDLLPMDRCIDVISAAMMVASRGDAIQPLRWIMDLPGDDHACFGTMPGYMKDPDWFGIKVTSVFPENHKVGLQSHQGAFVLFDRDDGRPAAIIHGGEITAIRTAAASAVATRVLSRSSSSSLAILGYGTQARMHLIALQQVRDIDNVTVWGRSRELAERFAEINSADFGIKISVADDVEQAVTNADIICTTTAAVEPILNGSWLEPGVHLNVVGSSTEKFREIDSNAVKRSRFFVDYKPMTLAEGGEFRAALKEGVIDESHILGEIGEVLLGRCVGRQSDTDITMFKSLGMPIEDLASAVYVYEAAQKADVGTVVDF